jgi:hypothetical protein
MAHVMGLILGIVGGFLTSSGWVGPSRLRNWDQQVRRWVIGPKSITTVFFRRTEPLMVWLVHRFESLSKILLFILIVLFVLGAVLTAFPKPFSGLLAVLFLFVVLLFVLVLSIVSVCLWVVIARTLLLSLLWLMLVPYRITHTLEKEDKDTLQRTFWLVGIMIGAFGVFLQLIP